MVGRNTKTAQRHGAVVEPSSGGGADGRPERFRAGDTPRRDNLPASQRGLGAH